MNIITATFPLTAEQIYQLKDTSMKTIAKVDVSAIQHPAFMPLQRTFFIYVRNLSVPTDRLDFDFSKLSYQSKCSFMTEYLTGDIECQIKELNAEVARALCRKLNAPYLQLPTIFTDEEEIQFISQHEHLLDEVASTLKAAMILAAKMSYDRSYQHVFDDSDIKMNMNFISIYDSCPNSLDFLPWHDPIQAKTQVNWTNVENTRKLLSISQKSRAVILLYGQQTSLWPAFEQMLASISL